MTKILLIFISLIAFTNLAAAADKGSKDRYNNSPIHYADNLESIKKLLAEGADVNAQGGDKFTPLHIATQNNKLEIVEELLANKADVSIEDLYGRTPLFYAQSEQVAAALILQKANPNNADKWKTTALHRAAKRCYAGVVKILLKNGVNVNAIDSWGCSPIHKIAACDNLEIAKAILEKGADINASCNDGASSLYYAAGYANLELVKYLLQNNAKFLLKNSNDTLSEIVEKSSYIVKPITLNSDPKIIKARAEIMKLLQESKIK